MIKKIGIKEARSLHPTACENRRYYGYFDKEELVGVVGIKFRAWFMSEICHLFVSPPFRKRGVGTKLVDYALTKVKTPLACATVLSTNDISLRIFTGLGFEKTKQFVNPATGNEVCLLVKKINDTSLG